MEPFVWLFFIAIVLGVAVLFIYTLIKSNHASKPQTPSSTLAYTRGEITAIQRDPSNNSIKVTIEYTINEVTYNLTELLSNKNKEIEIGQSVIIGYNTQDKSRAFWVANNSHKTL